MLLHEAGTGTAGYILFFQCWYDSSVKAFWHGIFFFRNQLNINAMYLCMYKTIQFIPFLFNFGSFCLSRN
jgi:hypothetical protein